VVTDKPLYSPADLGNIDISRWGFPDFDDELNDLLVELKGVVRKRIRKRIKDLKNQLLREASKIMQTEMDEHLLVHFSHDADLINNEPPYRFSPATNPRLLIDLPLGHDDMSGRAYDVDLCVMVDRLIDDNKGDDDSLRLWAGTFLILTEKVQAAIEAMDKAKTDANAEAVARAEAVAKIAEQEGLTLPPRDDE